MSSVGWIALAAVPAAAGAMLTWIRSTWLVVTVDGESMAPTYRPGQRILARRRLTPAAGDVVVFTTAEGGSLMLKRVVAAPGDPAPWFLSVHGDVVPPGMHAVMGDNVADSLDSRVLGYVAAQQMIGVVSRRSTARPRPRSSETRLERYPR